MDEIVLAVRAARQLESDRIRCIGSATIRACGPAGAATPRGAAPESEARLSSASPSREHGAFAAVPDDGGEFRRMCHGGVQNSTRVHFASFIGAVAQLGERSVRNAEVVGSTPIGSTIVVIPFCPRESRTAPK